VVGGGGGGAVGGSSVTQGAQTDRFTSVETLLGGSGNDTFTYGSSGPPEQSVDGQPAEEDTEIRIEGRGGNDLFVDSLATFLGLGVLSSAPGPDRGRALLALVGRAGGSRAVSPAVAAYSSPQSLPQSCGV
jgi:hypothetical protein